MEEIEQIRLFNIIKNDIKVDVAQTSSKRLKSSSQEPQYDKFYTLYAFDEIGYHRELKHVITKQKLKGVYCLPLAERKRIRNKHYSLDINGEKMPMSDEKHIFRMAVLHKIYNAIYSHFLFKFALFEDVTNIDGILFYQEELQAEIDGMQMKSIATRIYAHLSLLRLLKQGKNIKEAVNKIKELYGEKSCRME